MHDAMHAINSSNPSLFNFQQNNIFLNPKGESFLPRGLDPLLITVSLINILEISGIVSQILREFANIYVFFVNLLIMVVVEKVRYKI